MPHVELLGACDPLLFHQRFSPRTLRGEDRVCKVSGCFLSHDRRTLLVECLSVEGFLRQSFFVLINIREDGAMVRLLPRTSPEKTEGVKRCVAWIARWFDAESHPPGSPRMTIGVTNLPEYLDDPFPGGAESV